MKKDKRYVIILFLIMFVIILTSYFLFISGTTNKIKASLNKLDASVSDGNVSDYPVIKMVINSSGERLVNEDVSITIISESIYKIDKVYYSYDKQKWYDDVDEASFGKESNVRLVFDKTMNENLYIKVENEKGYQSYIYETKINIDKEKPKITVNKNNEIEVSDNVGLKSIQYSNDNINWETMEVSEKKVSLTKNNFEYKYIRVVDTSGNISAVKEVK